MKLAILGVMLHHPISHVFMPLLMKVPILPTILTQSQTFLETTIK